MNKHYKSLLIESALQQFNESGPYYTSYPTLGLWSETIKSSDYEQTLIDFFSSSNESKPVHLYVHIPFCAKLCWYCMCNITVTNKRERIEEFMRHILKEIDMLRCFLEKNNLNPVINEIQLGGGTPSHLDRDQFSRLIEGLKTLVSIDELEEFAMEIDPRTASTEDLFFYQQLGVNRISFGVQDFDNNVQKAINRIQPAQLIKELLTPKVRELFKGINFDLLFGLPLQTRETFSETLRITREFQPERITLLKYAHVPNIRKHMKLIKDDDLPAESELPHMFLDAVEQLTEHGYEWVGIDNFAWKTDSLAEAAKEKRVYRTFNGFTPGRTQHLFGLGPTTTSAIGNAYYQSVYGLKEYYEKIESGEFPVLRGYRLNQEECVRRSAIFSVICNLELDLEKLSQDFNFDCVSYFSTELEIIRNKFSKSNFIEFSQGGSKLHVTDAGRFIVRNIAKVFDVFNYGKVYKIGGC